MMALVVQKITAVVTTTTTANAFISIVDVDVRFVVQDIMAIKEKKRRLRKYKIHSEPSSSTYNHFFFGRSMYTVWVEEWSIIYLQCMLKLKYYLSIVWFESGRWHHLPVLLFFDSNVTIYLAWIFLYLFFGSALALLWFEYHHVENMVSQKCCNLQNDNLKI